MTYHLHLVHSGQAAMLLLSLRSNFHVEFHGKRGGKGHIRVSWLINDKSENLLCMDMMMFAHDSVLYYLFVVS